MMLPRLGSLFSALLLTVLLFSGCSFRQEPAAKLPEAKTQKIAFVYKTLANPFFLEMAQGAEQAAKEEGLSLLEYSCINETQVDEQIRYLNELTRQQVAGICLTPLDKVRLVPAVKKAENAGIKVLLVDNSLDSESAAQVGGISAPVLKTDNFSATHEGLQQILAPLDMPLEAAVLAGLPGSESSLQRLEGAMLAFREKPNINVVAVRDAYFRADQGYLQTKEIFAAHPKTGFIFAANDLMALGAIQYLQEAGRTDVLIVGYDGTPDAIEAIKKGLLRATIKQQASQMGYDSVKLLQRMLVGQPVPPLTLMQTIVIDKNNLR